MVPATSTGRWYVSIRFAGTMWRTLRPDALAHSRGPVAAWKMHRSVQSPATMIVVTPRATMSVTQGRDEPSSTHALYEFSGTPSAACTHG